LDTYDEETRSRVMSRIKSKGNASTEKRLRAGLVRAGVSGWVMHPTSVGGKPDFYFPSARLAVFVDGCFWHGCQKCYIRPKSNRKYWDGKLRSNLARDKKITRKLKSNGISVIRIWEHEVKLDLSRAIDKIKSTLIT
jgi:DNA mismatch endonuclease (patch repair protein)